MKPLSKLFFIKILVPGLFLGLGLGCTAGNGVPSEARGVSPPGEAAEESTVHPGEHGVHKDENEAAHADTVHVSPEQVEELNIKVEPLSAGSAASTLSRPATVQFDLDRVVKVGPRLEAKVVKVLKDLGDRVAAGEPVAIMSSVGLGKAKAEYLTARAGLERDRRDYERENNLYEKNISSEADMLAAKADYESARAKVQALGETLRLFGLGQDEINAIQAGGEKPLSYFEPSSPIDGIVQKRDLTPGQTLTSAETPIHLADLRQVWVMIDAYERDVPLLSPGQTVEFTVRSLPGRTFEGKIDWVSQALDPKSRTIRVRAIIQNSDLALRAGMFGTARIHTGQAVQNALIPVEAVQTVENRDVVFVPGEERGAFQAVTVRLGDESEGCVEILSGVQPGDRVVSSGAFHLKSTLSARTRSAAHVH